MDLENRANLNAEKSDVNQQSLTPPLNAAIIAALFDAEIREKKLAQRVLGLQVLILLLAVGLAYSWKSSPQYAMAVLGGGVVSVLNSVLLAWRMVRVAQNPNHNAHQQLRLMFLYAAERFLAVIVSLGICFAVLKLTPLGVLGGFVLGQTVLVLARLFLKIKIEDSD